MILRPSSRSCRTASIRSGIAGGLAGELWNWLDRHSQQFGLHRPLPGADPAHVQPIAGWRQLAEKLRDERRAAASDSDRGSVAATEPDSIFSRAANSFLLSEEQFTCSRARQFASTNKVHNPTHPIRTSHSKEHQINRREKTARDHTHPASSGRNAQIKGRGSRSRRAGESLAGASFATLATASAVSQCAHQFASEQPDLRCDCV